MQFQVSICPAWSDDPEKIRKRAAREKRTQDRQQKKIKKTPTQQDAEKQDIHFNYTVMFYNEVVVNTKDCSTSASICPSRNS